MRHVIALDVGGTGMKGALVGPDGTALHQDRRATRPERGPREVVGAVLEFADALRAYGREAFGEPAEAAGVAVPGRVDEAAGTAVYSANLGWRDVPLRDLLARRLGGVPVALGHDLRAGGLAEGRLGAGRGRDRFLFVAVGTGVAAAIGVDGRIEPGAHGCAGELGHLMIRPGGRSCPCGKRGCLETVGSAAAVAREWARVSGRPGAGAADCAAAVAGGDPAAGGVWQAAVEALADGLALAVTLLDPGALIVGGGLAEAGDVLLGPLRGALGRRLTFEPVPAVLPAELGDAAGCLGAGLLAWERVAPAVAG